MVALSIVPGNGNHARYYPHTGQLGLTPVRISGTVLTRIEEDDQLLDASRVVIRARCYEAVGSSWAVQLRPDQSPFTLLKHPPSSVNVLYQTEQTLWNAATAEQQEASSSSSSSSHLFRPLGNSSYQWSLTIPTQAVQPRKGTIPAVGTSTFKNWRAWWLLEAVIYHKSVPVIGDRTIKSYPLFLPNHRSRSQLSRLTPRTHLQSSNAQFVYSITAPGVLCSGEDGQLSVTIQMAGGATDEAVVLKRLSVSLVRTLAIRSSTSHGLDPSPPKPRWKLHHKIIQPTVPRPRIRTQSQTGPDPAIQSAPAELPARPSSSCGALQSQTGSSSTVFTTTILKKQVVSHPVILTTSGGYEKVVGIQVPQNKSRYHYSIGESCRTRLASVEYQFVLKATVKSKSRGIETLYLNPLEVALS